MDSVTGMDSLDEPALCNSGGFSDADECFWGQSFVMLSFKSEIAIVNAA